MMYVCPKCRADLINYRCVNCGAEFEVMSGAPYFLALKGSRDVPAIGAVYDSIYRHHSNVWEDQGRPKAFLEFIAALVRELSTGPLLEVGCGEGLLLREFANSERYGIDPSIEAVLRARANSGAECAAAQAEFLPFPAAAFDVVVAIGVMEHFERPDDASAEIWRVLRTGGHFLVLIHTDMTFWQRLQQKLQQFFYPRLRPLAFSRWILKKVRKPIKQPNRRGYTRAGAEALLASAGFGIAQVLNRRVHPAAPFAGDHVLLIVARKRSADAAV